MAEGDSFIMVGIVFQNIGANIDSDDCRRIVRAKGM